MSEILNSAYYRDAGAFNTALALESTRFDGCRFSDDGSITFTSTEDLVHYASIVAYKTANNMVNGHVLDVAKSPLNKSLKDGHPDTM